MTGISQAFTIFAGQKTTACRTIRFAEFSVAAPFGSLRFITSNGKALSGHKKERYARTGSSNKQENYMSGSVFVYTDDQEKLKAIAEDFDALDDFDHVALETLITLDFEQFSLSAGINWCDDDPVYFDEESGLAIVKVNEHAIKWMVQNAYKLDLDDDQKADISVLNEFVTKFPVSEIFEVSTF